MKLTSIEIHPHNSLDIMVLSFRDPRSQNPFGVKSIIGLDADELISKYYGKFGATKFYNISLGQRNIVLQLQLNPNFTINQSYSDLRDTVYKTIASSRSGKVDIMFKNNTTTVAILSGFVTKIDTPHFEKNQEIQISIKCDEPLLKAIAPVNVSVAGLNPLSTVITDPLSTAPHGFTFDLNVITNGLTAFTIQDPNDNWYFTVSPASGLLVGDILHVSSEYNNKELYITRGASIVQIADKVYMGSVWPIIFPGANTFSINNSTYFTWNAISYYPTYWGV